MKPRLYTCNDWVIDLNRLELVKGLEENSKNTNPYYYEFIYNGVSYTTRFLKKKEATESRNALITAWGDSGESIEDGIL